MSDLVIINTHSEYPRWAQKSEIGGKLYNLYFSWNDRLGIWGMSISDVDNKLLLGGLRLVPEIDLLKKYKSEVKGLPEGILYIADTLNDPSTAELDRNNFGTRFALMYMRNEGGE